MVCWWDVIFSLMFTALWVGEMDVFIRNPFLLVVICSQGDYLLHLVCHVFGFRLHLVMK